MIIRRPRRVVLATSAILLAAALAGCASGPASGLPHPIDVVVGLGYESNAPVPAVLPSLGEKLALSAASGGDYAIVSGGGKPYLADHNAWGGSSDDDSVRRQQREQTLSGFGQRLLRVIPVDSEEAPLATLALATRSFMAPGHEKWILMISSGLSTVDPLNMARGENLYRDPDQVAAELSNGGDLPDLSNITVYWSGLGDTVGSSQTELDVASRAQLIRTWTRIIAMAHGRLVVLDTPLPAVDPTTVAPKLPLVSPVYIRPAETWIAPVQLTDNRVKFQPQTADFVSDTDALAVLRPIAARLIATGAHVTLTGTTARQRSKESQIATGLLRAQKVQLTLESLGVPASQLGTATVGSYWSCYIDERRADGTIDEAISASDRSIVITADGQSIESVCS